MSAVNTWYRVVIDGEERIVRIDTYTIRYAIVDYYDGSSGLFRELVSVPPRATSGFSM